MALADYFNVINEKDSALNYAQSAYKKAKETEKKFNEKKG